MHFLRSAKYLSGYEYELTFEDGIIKIVDLQQYLTGEVFEPLNDLDFFKTGRLDPDTDTIVWENGADFSPDFLYEIGVDVALSKKLI